MKKFLAVFIAFVVAFSFGNSTKAMSVFNGITTSDHVSVLSGEILEGIQIELDSKTMIRGEEQEIRVMGLYNGGVKKPIDASNVKWTPSDPTIATVTSGKLKALAAGDVALFTTYNGYPATVTVKVKDFKELKSVGDVSVDKIWDVKFNGRLDTQTTAENIIVLDNNGVSFPVRTNYITNQNGSIVQVMPKNPYIPGKTYTIWVKDVQSLSGKSLKYYTKMNFTIKK